jgi:hypothetical protein
VATARTTTIMAVVKVTSNSTMARLVISTTKVRTTAMANSSSTVASSSSMGAAREAMARNLLSTSRQVNIRVFPPKLTNSSSPVQRRTHPTQDATRTIKATRTSSTVRVIQRVSAVSWAESPEVQPVLSVDTS